jgi:hypothetical protein
MQFEKGGAPVAVNHTNSPMGQSAPSSAELALCGYPSIPVDHAVLKLVFSVHGDPSKFLHWQASGIADSAE